MPAGVVVGVVVAWLRVWPLVMVVTGLLTFVKMGWKRIWTIKRSRGRRLRTKKILMLLNFATLVCYFIVGSFE